MADMHEYEIVIDSKPLSPLRIIPDLVQYRDLLVVLTQREIQVRYSQTILGILWVLIQPLGNMAVAWVVFGKFARLDSGKVPYPLFCLIGMQVWLFFSNGLANAGQSLVNQSSLIGKVYFPRLVLPLACSLAALLDFFISGAVLLVVLGITGYLPGLNALMVVPFVVTGLFIFTSGAGIFSAALCARYRDLRHVIPFALQIAFFATPIVYSTELIPERFREFFFLNPLAGYIQGLRALILHEPIQWATLAKGFLVSTIVWFIGASIFMRFENSMADSI